MEFRVPVKKPNQGTVWVTARAERTVEQGGLVKAVTVRNNFVGNIIAIMPAGNALPAGIMHIQYQSLSSQSICLIKCVGIPAMYWPLCRAAHASMLDTPPGSQAWGPHTIGFGT